MICLGELLFYVKEYLDDCFIVKQPQGGFDLIKQNGQRSSYSQKMIIEHFGTIRIKLAERIEPGTEEQLDIIPNNNRISYHLWVDVRSDLKSIWKGSTLVSTEEEYFQESTVNPIHFSLKDMQKIKKLQKYFNDLAEIIDSSDISFKDRMFHKTVRQNNEKLNKDFSKL